MSLKSRTFSLAKNWLRLSDTTRIYVLLSKPPIVTGFWTDFYKYAEALYGDTKAFPLVSILSFFGWQYETPERADGLLREVREVQQKCPNFRIIFLCNSPRELEALKHRGLKAHLCHHNAFLDESSYKIIPSRKIFDAIYVARITPFKRHMLAERIKKLHLIGDFRASEQAYVDKIMKLLPQAKWDRYIPGRIIAREINKAHVGICLSAEEGGNYCTGEYLLCGIPVVSTKCKGGRDEFFTAEYSRITADDADEVANAVEELACLKLKARDVRQATFNIMQAHRQKFQEVLAEACESVEARTPVWNDYFVNKLGIGMRAPLIQFKRREWVPGFKFRNCRWPTFRRIRRRSIAASRRIQ